MKRVAVSLLVGLFLCQQAALGNLIKNGEFTEGGDKPAGWSIVENAQKISAEKIDDRTTLKVEIVKEGGTSLGEIRQTVKVKKNTKYRLSADLKSTKAGLLVVQVKPRANRKELDRITSSASKADWETVTKEFNSGEADEVQVLCRFFQKANFVGASGWFSKVVLDELDAEGKVVETKAAAASGGGAKAPDAPAAPATPVVAAPGTDQFVSVSGAGDKSGKDLANARPAADLQAAIDAAGPGNTVYIGSGTYEIKGLKIGAGGSGADAVKTISGKDTGAGLPLFKSNFDKTNPAKSGITLFALGAGVNHVTIRDVRAENVRIAVVIKGNSGIRVENVDVTQSRDAIWVEGPASDIVLKDCDIKYYTKRAARLFGGVTKAQVINCHADAGGKEWAVEVFPMGFQVGAKGEAPDSQITFTDCSAANNWHDAGPDKYWNADGFCAESAVSDLTYIRCLAYGNTDGGWDVKASRAKWIDCIGIANKRNFRVWPDAGADGAVFENCLSAYAIDYGNRGHQCGLWIKAGGNVTYKNVTSWADPVGIKLENPGDQPVKSTVRLEHCLIQPIGTVTSVAEGTDLQNEGSIVQKAGEGTDATLKQPSNDWRGGSDAFDCVSQPGLGYRHGARSKPETAAVQR